MPLSSNILSGLIKSNLAAVGANGSNLSIFCDAVAKGIVESIVGKAFATLDTGTVPGIGTGVGIGILGLSSPIMKSTALSLMDSKGVNADKLMQAIMDATVTHLSVATLMSNDTPVFLGTGIVVVGSIAVMTGEMSGNIDSELQNVGAKGVNRTKLATAIGTGVASNILSSGTGTLIITGSPIGTPVPGSGSGIGIIS